MMTISEQNFIPAAYFISASENSQQPVESGVFISNGEKKAGPVRLIGAWFARQMRKTGKHMRQNKAAYSTLAPIEIETIVPYRTVRVRLCK